MPLTLARPFASVFAVTLLASLVVTTPAAAQAKPAAKAAAAVAQKPAGSVALIDINRATAAELEAIPGIGKAYAAKIIGGRPYANKAQLVQKNILGQALYDRVKDRLIARQ